MLVLVLDTLALHHLDQITSLARRDILLELGRRHDFLGVFGDFGSRCIMGTWRFQGALRTPLLHHKFALEIDGSFP